MQRPHLFDQQNPPLIDLSCLQAWVYFYPTEDQQKTCDSCGEQGLNGDLVIVYDVNRDNSLGDIKVQRELIPWKTVDFGLLVVFRNNLSVLPYWILYSPPVFSDQSNLLTPPKTSDGYFVHHFAPSSLPRIPKNVVFVIDQSGSMHGRKIQQVQFEFVAEAFYL